MSTTIHVIATTISGSISDWSKVERIQPLFAEHGFDDLHLHVVDSHAGARKQAHRLVTEGRRLLISAGGSGTFNAVLEGCCDAKVPLGDIRLGFLRKGSADLLGKVLGMPDEIEAAVAVFAESIRAGHVMACDVLSARSEGSDDPPRHFVGYGGAEIFGRIPFFTENRFMKWYKGVLSQVFGDLGPFTLGMTLALLEKILKGPFGRKKWQILLDGQEVAAGPYQALIIVNGYLGPDMPYSDDALGSGCFHLFALSDLGARRLIGQARHARNGTIMQDPSRWGMTHFHVKGTLTLESVGQRSFPLNVDGSTLRCRGAATIRRVGEISLIARLPV
ncbi:MAG: diacylglycerol kinase family protein [Candidatus Krumholzibacteriota bacterium]